MSELKRCPLCNSEFELDTDKRFYIHPLVGCYFDCLIIKADNENSIKNGTPENQWKELWNDWKIKSIVCIT
jgi:hydrogenase maturation factor HypF (carbamoyltransferase family)